MESAVNSQEEGLLPDWTQCLGLSLCLLLGGIAGVRQHSQLHVGISQSIGVHGGEVGCLDNW